MSLFVPLRRATLLIPSGPQHDPQRKHLFVLLSDPVLDESAQRRVAMVSISSIKTGLPFDETCVLQPGEHPFIRHASFVLYQRARLEAADKLLRGVKQGVLIPCDPMPLATSARLEAGLLRSPMTPLQIKRWFERYAA